MQKIKKKNIKFNFNNELYNIKDVFFITSEKFWDGGIYASSSLKEKAEFYSLSEKMSNIIKKIICLLNDDIIIGEPLCEHHRIFAQWKDLKKHQIFKNLSELIKKHSYYKLFLPEDSDVIDTIIESNFNYFSFVSFYLPNSEIIIQPTCHTEVLIYSFEQEKIIEIIEKAIRDYPDIVLTR